MIDNRFFAAANDVRAFTFASTFANAVNGEALTHEDYKRLDEAFIVFGYKGISGDNVQFALPAQTVVELVRFEIQKSKFTWCNFLFKYREYNEELKEIIPLQDSGEIAYNLQRFYVARQEQCGVNQFMVLQVVPYGGGSDV